MAKNLKFFLLCAVMTWLAACEAGKPSSETQIPPSSTSEPSPTYAAPTVAFCELVRNPKLYSGKVVRTQGIVWAGLENQSIYEPACYSEDTATWVEFENTAASMALDDGLEANRGSNRARRVNAALTGRLEGPSKEGFGHLNGFRYQFVIMSVEKIMAVPPEVPWSWEMKRAS